MRLADIHACVQDLLLKQGAYDPLELLVAAGTLSYQDCTAWRRGERAAVETVLDTEADAIAAVLDAAADWARKIGLVSRPISESCLEERQPSSSGHVRLNALLGTMYRWSEERTQLDLFADSADSVAVGALVDALLERDSVAAEKALARLEAGSATYRHVGHAKELVNALSSASTNHPENAATLLERIEKRWLPAANAVLAARSGDFLTPLWRSAARALEDHPFDPDEPRQHASWAFSRCRDWEGVRRSVLGVAGHRKHPELVARLADAEWRLGARLAAIELWFDLCWEAPQTFEPLVAHGFPDWAVRRSWSRAKEQDLDPEISPPWFPAWMLIEEPGLARVLPARQGEGNAIRAYNVLRGLIGGQDGEVQNPIALRRALKAAHPGLLAQYLVRKERK